MAAGERKGVGTRLGGLLQKGRQLLNTEEGETPESERRVSGRLALRIPVQACAEGGKFRPSRILDINLRGFALDALAGAEPDQGVAVAFTGVPDVAPTFTLNALVVRRRPDGGLGLRVDRERSSAEALQHYRKLVLFYLRHRPLLEDVDKGYFEGRCEACGWIGRVGARTPVCSRCGQRVAPLPK